MNISKDLILIDKPSGWTSFDCVAKIRGRLKTQNVQLPPISRELGNSQELVPNSPRLRVGHAGTLDPFATGLLLILVGAETKNQANYMKQDKEYQATLCFGKTSTTGDPEGEISKNINAKEIEKSDIEAVLKNFIGLIEQTPPQHSAIKINGQRAYKLARKGELVEIKPRKIKIYNIKVIKYVWPELVVDVLCSSGTYVRTLAEDIGKELGCGAYLTALRRTKIGDFNIQQAQTMDSIIADTQGNH
ncbi:MAG: tRNA pseudouridine(55) synthase TruB [bacterium]